MSADVKVCGCRLPGVRRATIMGPSANLHTNGLTDALAVSFCAAIFAAILSCRSIRRNASDEAPMRLQRFSFLWCALIRFILVALVCCTTAFAQDESKTDWPTKEWQTSTPEQQGMDSAALARLLDFGATHSFDSLLVARHGLLVLDAYYAPYSANAPHAVNSTTKSIVATLIAMLHADGVLDSLDHHVLDYFFPYRDFAYGDDNMDGKRAITVQNLLNMTSGLAWQEGPGDDWWSLRELQRSRDSVRFILDLPMADRPGETFNYNSGNSHLLSALITRLTRRPAEDFARDRLFGPLGITDYIWPKDPMGQSYGGWGLRLKPRDMAKIGYLYLRHGRWEDQQLLPSQWIETVSHATVNTNLSGERNLRYANQFWALPDKHIFMTVGYHCQVIMVLPDLDAVAVTTGRGSCPLGKLADGIAGAVRSDTALPASPEAATSLAGAIRKISNLELSVTPGEPEKR
jgi:CubicO group peptidase (beta-lactamase class C family)